MIYLTQRLDHAHRVTASVTLPIDVRVKSRARVALNDGREAGLMLPRGLLLRGGDLLSTEDGSEVIEVIAAPESVSVVRCADPFLLAKACYHLGNRHVPLQILPDELRYHHDHVLDDMLQLLPPGVPERTAVSHSDAQDRGGLAGQQALEVIEAG